MADFEVRRDDLRATRITAGEQHADAVGAGEVQLRVDRFRGGHRWHGEAAYRLLDSVLKP